MNWLLLQNSLAVASLTVLVSGALGFVAALGLAGVTARWRQSFVGLAIVALAMPPFLVTNCWLDLLGAGGALRGWLPLNLFSLGGTVWILALLTWPITTLAVLTSWQRLEPSQLESEPALRGPALVRWLLWPMAQRALAWAAGLTLVLALNNFTVPAILQVKVLPAEMWVGFSTNLDSLAALRVGWPLIAVPLAALLWLGRERATRWPRLEGRVSAKLFRRQLGCGWFSLGLGGAGLLAILSVGAPLVQLAFHPRTWLELLPALGAGTNALSNSVAHAVITATLTVGIALVGLAGRATPRGGAWPSRPQKCDLVGPRAKFFGAFQRLGFLCPGRALSGAARGDARPTHWAALLWLPLFVPGIFLGLALIWMLNRPGLDWFYRSTAVVLLALVIRFLAPAFFGARLALRGVDHDLIDSARLEGAGGWRLFHLVQWPQIKAQVAAIWYVIYLLSLWDVETLVLILPPGGETLALRVFNLLHYGHSAQVNALCVWLLLVAVLPLVAWRVARWLYVLRFTFYGTRAAVACMLAGGVLVGCNPKPPSNSDPIHSQFFSRVEIIGTRGAGSGEFNKPRSLALDKEDNLYVADMTGRVQKFSPDGKFLLAWQMPQTDLGKAKGMARDRDGNIVVLEPHYQRVNHFSPAGQILAHWGSHLTNGGPFSLPRAVAVNSHGDVIVSEYTLRERVQVFTARGQQRRLEFGKAGTGPGEFNRPEGVAVDATDRIYVADSCNHRVQVFSPEGKFLRAYGRAGRGPGELSYPYDLAVDAAGRQFVCEFGNSRVQIFDASDRSLEILGGAGDAPGRFANPWSLALDSRGNLYVADSQNHRVQKFIARP